VEGRLEVRRKVVGVLGLIILFGGATASRAEVRRVEMHIAGYLCGN
jgi:hypothetical protein